MARIERELQRMDTLVGELLTLSRLKAGGAHDKREVVDLSELLREVVSDAAFEARLDGREVALAATPHVLLEGRSELLHRALENVIRNAVRYTAEDTTVEVRLERREQSLDIAVCDRGPGVAEAELETMFDPFVRSGEAQAGDGYGLGLAIARSVIEAHDGCIEARNRPGGGLCVHIRMGPGATNEKR
jgi:two-component system OmpR family sensor kinase